MPLWSFVPSGKQELCSTADRLSSVQATKLFAVGSGHYVLTCFNIFYLVMNNILILFSSNSRPAYIHISNMVWMWLDVVGSFHLFKYIQKSRSRGFQADSRNIFKSSIYCSGAPGEISYGVPGDIQAKSDETTCDRMNKALEICWKHSLAATWWFSALQDSTFNHHVDHYHLLCFLSIQKWII